ncbi:alpha/beta hydrolase [Proteus terrae]|uniref:RBBP9/YdeN family alpha/beta hydrolase n=1 Tax=Proteus terrae TaxID=1574161 RepID=UPI002095AD30|nr:alpha/beta hydrolase [Proteus terrae]MCS6715665.1 alpha/beta hydrolase [Proteus terrae]MCS6734012.1 alpha/beta hydrolase [Proteus terrae]
MKGKRIFIIHGYTASPEDNWFPWLKEKLEALGCDVAVPTMPESNSPEPKRWQQQLTDANIKLDKDTILIGHSLGCITLLRFLSEQSSENVKIGGYILVSGFDRKQDTLPELNSHIYEQLDYNKLIKISDKRVSVISSNDWVVDPQASKDLANRLQTEIIIEDNAGHFLDREGYTELPILLDIFKNMLE